jgi:hypothetical protein
MLRAGESLRPIARTLADYLNPEIRILSALLTWRIVCAAKIFR